MTTRITRKTLKAIPKQFGSEQFKLYLAMQLEKALRQRRYKPPAKPRRKPRPPRVGQSKPAGSTASSDAGFRRAQEYMQEELKKAIVDNTIERTNQIKKARADAERALLEPPQKDTPAVLPPRPLAIAAPLPATVDADDPTIVPLPESPRGDEKKRPDIDGKKPYVPTVTLPEAQVRSMMDKWAEDAFIEATNAVAPSSYTADALETSLRRAVDEKLVKQAVVDEVMALGGHEPLPVDQLLKSKKKGHANKDTRHAILIRTPGSELDQAFTNTFRGRYSSQLRASGAMKEPIVKQETEAALQRTRKQRIARLGYGSAGKTAAADAGQGVSGPGSRPLSNLDLDKLMRKSPAYLGTFSRDNFPGTQAYVEAPGGQGPRSVGGSTACWIMNTDPSDMPGKHWVAVFIDPVQSKTCEYYDPFGEPCPDDIFNVLAKLAPKLSPDSMLKFKENLAVNQSELTNNCGYFCLRFLLHRLAGKPWTFASGFVDLREDEIERFKRTHPLFKGFTKFV